MVADAINLRSDNYVVDVEFAEVKSGTSNRDSLHRSRRPVQRGSYPWRRIILPHLENTRSSLDTVSGTPSGDEGARQGGIRQIDREGVIQHPARARRRHSPSVRAARQSGGHFECGHEHGVGDRCLSFDFDPDYFEEVVASVPGVRHLFFTMPRLSPSETLIPVIAAAEVADDDLGFEEAALRVAGAAVTAENGASEAVRNLRHERRVAEVLRRIEEEPDEPVTLSRLARDAAMSPYQFLRTFNAVSGITPYQFVFAQRLRRAAVRLRPDDRSDFGNRLRSGLQRPFDFQSTLPPNHGHDT